MKNLNTRLLRFTKLLEFSVALCLMVAIVIAAGMALLDTTALVIAGDFQFCLLYTSHCRNAITFFNAQSAGIVNMRISQGIHAKHTKNRS